MYLHDAQPSDPVLYLQLTPDRSACDRGNGPCRTMITVATATAVARMRLDALEDSDPVRAAMAVKSSPGAQVRDHGCARKWESTEARLLADIFDPVRVSVGVIFRWNVQHHTQLGCGTWSRSRRRVTPCQRRRLLR